MSGEGCWGFASDGAPEGLVVLGEGGTERLALLLVILLGGGKEVGGRGDGIFLVVEGNWKFGGVCSGHG